MLLEALPVSDIIYAFILHFDRHECPLGGRREDYIQMREIACALLRKGG
jgi:hypothetical protein